jgi:hypothetical protein
MIVCEKCPAGTGILDGLTMFNRPSCRSRDSQASMHVSRSQAGSTIDETWQWRVRQVAATS